MNFEHEVPTGLSAICARWRANRKLPQERLIDLFAYRGCMFQPFSITYSLISTFLGGFRVNRSFPEAIFSVKKVSG